MTPVTMLQCRKFLWIVVSMMVIVLTGCTVTDNPQTSKDNNATAAAKEFDQIKTIAEAGNAKAQYVLGFMYENGQGVRKDYSKACFWYRKAADQGQPNAQTNLGQMYEDGMGIEQDYQQAVGWYRRGAEQGDMGSQCLLGKLYVENKGVIEDYVEAYKWFLLAEMNRTDNEYFIQMLQSSKQIRQHIQEKMTPEQIAEAQKRAKEFVPKAEGATQSEVQRLK